MSRASFLARAKVWASKHRLLGPQAFSKYVMFCFLDAVNEVSDDFILKGGNLLWIYIQTPRVTVDLDLATLKTDSHDQVKRALEAAGDRIEGIKFKVLSFTPVERNERKAVAVVVAFETDKGARNQFELDIVYASPVVHHKLPSPVDVKRHISGATIENILVDKIATCVRFGSGNSRIKDFDDLWRIADSNLSIDRGAFKTILNQRRVNPHLLSEWITPEMAKSWERHAKRYPDLPASLQQVIDEFNGWIKQKLA